MGNASTKENLYEDAIYMDPNYGFHLWQRPASNMVAQPDSHSKLLCNELRKCKPAQWLNEGFDNQFTWKDIGYIKRPFSTKVKKCRLYATVIVPNRLYEYKAIDNDKKVYSIDKTSKIKNNDTIEVLGLNGNIKCKMQVRLNNNNRWV